MRQKDRDARWTKKHGRSFFGYKNHVNADAKHKLIRHYAVTREITLTRSKPSEVASLPSSISLRLAIIASHWSM